METKSKGDITFLKVAYFKKKIKKFWQQSRKWNFVTVGKNKMDIAVQEQFESPSKC